MEEGPAYAITASSHPPCCEPPILLGAESFQLSAPAAFAARPRRWRGRPYNWDQENVNYFLLPVIKPPMTLLMFLNSRQPMRLVFYATTLLSMGINALRSSRFLPFCTSTGGSFALQSRKPRTQSYPWRTGSLRSRISPFGSETRASPEAHGTPPAIESRLPLSRQKAAFTTLKKTLATPAKIS
jgi:hypothetical protein